MITKLIDIGKSQNDIMISIVNQESIINPTTFSESAYISAVINDMSITNGTNLITNLIELFGIIY